MKGLKNKNKKKQEKASGGVEDSVPQLTPPRPLAEAPMAPTMTPTMTGKGITTNELFADANSKMQRSIDFVDTLRREGIERDLAIPQIAVAGDQSTGKSSVLEAISGIPFPRGTGTVTKCAIRICMRQATEWQATICHRVDTGATSTNDGGGGTMDASSQPESVATKEELGKAIEKHQGLVCDSGNVIGGGVVEITLQAPDVLSLTLIDLPGIVRATNDRGVTEDTIKQVDRLVESYLKQERTIILAVLASNTDPATQDILQRASKYDPLGKRTMGLLTKPDLIDKGDPEAASDCRI